MPARTGRHSGDLNFGYRTKTSVAAPIVVIFPVCQCFSIHRLFVWSYHRPVEPDQRWLSTKSIVDRRHKGSPDQEHDAHIIKLVAKLGHMLGVVRDRVIDCGHAQANNRSKEEASEDPHVLISRLLESRLDRSIQYAATYCCEYCTDEMCVDVDSFVVKMA